jgi:hypothetical protein
LKIPKETHYAREILLKKSLSNFEKFDPSIYKINSFKNQNYEFKSPMLKKTHNFFSPRSPTSFDSYKNEKMDIDFIEDINIEQHIDGSVNTSNSNAPDSDIKFISINFFVFPSEKVIQIR